MAIVMELPKEPIKKLKKKKEEPKKRIIVCGTTSWNRPNVVRKIFKELEPKTIEFIVTDTSRGASLYVLQFAKHLGIPVYQAHPYKDKFIGYDAAIRLFKPNLILAFNENPKENTATEGYMKLAHRKDIDFRMVSK